VGKILLLPSVLAMLTRRRLDSSVFYVLEKSGAMILPGASQDGIYYAFENRSWSFSRGNST
jgi:hypothetical protein